MKIALIDVDGHNFPNLPLMKLAAWHKFKGHEVFMYSPLFSPPADIAYMSKVFDFTDDYPYAVNADDKAKASNDFINGNVQYMVANPASAGHGLTWVNSNYAVYYSMDFNYETWYQSTKRIHRRGQNSRTFYYTLVAEGTLEKRIVKAIQNKQGLQDFIEEIINDGKPAEKQVQEMVSDRV